MPKVTVVRSKEAGRKGIDIASAWLAGSPVFSTPRASIWNEKSAATTRSPGAPALLLLGEPHSPGAEDRDGWHDGPCGTSLDNSDKSI